MRIKKLYEAEADIPAGVRDHYEERDGKWHLTLEVEGAADGGDVARLNGALTKERSDHRATKDKLRAFDGLDPERTRAIVERISDLGEWGEVEKKLHRLDEAGGDASDAAVEQRVEREVERRIKAHKAPLERQIKQLEERATGAEREREEARGTLRSRTMADDLRGAAVKLKVQPSALEDVLMYGDRLFELNEAGETVTRDNVGVTPGLKPEAWLTDMQERRPHWWPPTEGAGARGNRGGGPLQDNPFSAEAWNVTEQGRLAQADPAKAKRFAEAAGTTLGGPKPAPRQRAA